MEIEYINFYKFDFDKNDMVRLENITRAEEERKLHIERTRKLLDRFFDNILVLGSSDAISVREKGKLYSLLYINISSNKIKLSVPDEENIPKYTDKAIAFAKEYEKLVGKEITLQTNYSK